MKRIQVSFTGDTVRRLPKGRPIQIVNSATRKHAAADAPINGGWRDLVRQRITRAFDTRRAHPFVGAKLWDTVY